jgi:hypothetical protein
MAWVLPVLECVVKRFEDQERRISELAVSLKAQLLK